ncbi:hypothetical protein [Lysobacter gummosus]|uniref:hypothetical protein n=1 Tax=Lysobacter gummosus TaxID=262324 RepID=UPI00363AE6C9
MHRTGNAVAASGLGLRPGPAPTRGTLTSKRGVNATAATFAHKTRTAIALSIGHDDRFNRRNRPCR